MTQKHMKNMPYTVSEGEEHHVKSEDEIDKSHNSQLKFEYEVYLFTQNKKNLNWAFEVFRFFKNLINLGF